MRVGRKLRIQAAVGHRAAVIDLKPGLYLVAEIPETATRTEFGLAPILAPLMVHAAIKAIDAGAAAASLPPEERPQPLRVFRAQPRPAPPALPAPVARPTLLLPAPNVAWADDQTVAEVLGCDAVDRRRR